MSPPSAQRTSCYKEEACRVRPPPVHTQATHTRTRRSFLLRGTTAPARFYGQRGKETLAGFASSRKKERSVYCVGEELRRLAQPPQQQHLGSCMPPSSRGQINANDLFLLLLRCAKQPLLQPWYYTPSSPSYCTTMAVSGVGITHPWTHE